ncbi:MAG: DUF2842 domain-containing protein [Pacificimonas sp.]
MTDDPKLRKPLGVIAMILLIFAYVVLVIGLFPMIADLHVFVQTPIWIILGIAWIFPMKPLVRWIELGKWRA